MIKKVELQSTPTAVHPNTPGFLVDEFDALIYEKGYRVVLEHALQCPCKSQRVNELSTCKNCGGTGWIFINPIETRMVLYNQNENTQYKAWSMENIGNVGISVMNKDRLLQMDRITLIESTANFNQVRHFKKTDSGVLFSYCSYHIKSINYVGLFISDSQRLVKLEQVDDYTFDGNKVFLTSKFLAGFNAEDPYSITISYLHQPQYHVIDIPRQVANSRTSLNAKETLQQLPIHAMGKRAHFILDGENINSDRLLDNSYADPSCGKIIKVVDSWSEMC